MTNTEADHSAGAEHSRYSTRIVLALWLRHFPTLIPGASRDFLDRLRQNDNLALLQRKPQVPRGTWGFQHTQHQRNAAWEERFATQDLVVRVRTKIRAPAAPA